MITHITLISEWIVDKRRSETYTSCCPMCLHKRLQLMPAQSGVNIEAISSSTCIISTAPAADVLAPSLISLAVLIPLCSRRSLIRLYGVLGVPFDCSSEAFSNRIRFLYLD
ncbi:hypothetical protein TNCV_3881981 [Trichonephila clavipes]|nr:hypothetical protein TNCV_3881981 [Trichonephila clavipes]